MAEPQFLSLDQDLSLLLHSVATMLLVRDMQLDQEIAVNYKAFLTTLCSPTTSS